jgi:hypothetical protein
MPPLLHPVYMETAIAAIGQQRGLHRAGRTGSGHILAIGNPR